MKLSNKSGLEGVWEHSMRLKWFWRILLAISSFLLLVLIFSGTLHPECMGFHEGIGWVKDLWC